MTTPPLAAANRFKLQIVGVVPTSDATVGTRRVLTWPNLISACRLLCIPVFVWLLVGDHGHGDRHAGWLGAAILLAALGATDWVDGQLARRLRQVSTLGKVLDPLADRLLLGVAVISIVAVGAVPVWVAVIALAREATVAAGALVVFLAGGRRIDVHWIGKAGTFALMVAFPLFLAGHAPVSWHRGATDLAWVIALPGLALAWAAAASYLPDFRRSLAERGSRPVAFPHTSAEQDIGPPG